MEHPARWCGGEVVVATHWSLSATSSAWPRALLPGVVFFSLPLISAHKGLSLSNEFFLFFFFFCRKIHKCANVNCSIWRANCTKRQPDLWFFSILH